MELFHVWLKYCVEYWDVKQRLVTFVDREAADQWWRMISTPPSVYAGRVRRMSPQLYVQIRGDDIWDSFYNDQAPGPSPFLNRMVFNPTAIVPQIRITDHISGRWYFIRSRANSSSHWYMRTRGRCAVCGDATCGAIHVSNDYRTRFCVRVRDGSRVPDNFVLIGTDKISITALKGYIVHITQEQELEATKKYQGEIDFLFGDLKNRFITRAEKQASGVVWEYVECVERGEGEVWELVE